MSVFRTLLSAGVSLFFDGGMGTMLQGRGLPAGESPEAFSVARPDILKAIHKEYALAGADVITTNTFGGTHFKLPLGMDVFSFNRRMAELARQAADEAGQECGRKIFVAGSLGPTGIFLRPLGDLAFEALVAAFREQIRGLVTGGVDLIIAETQFDLAEARAAVIAVRQESSLPVGVSMTFEAGISLTGTSPEVFAATCTNLAVDFIGTNCSAGPAEMGDVVRRLAAVSPLPLLVQPNAGIPELVDGATVFRLGPGPFAEITKEFSALGVRMLGGCCGTTPGHIAALRTAVGTVPDLCRPPLSPGVVMLTNRSSLVRIGAGNPFCLIGERINPTGKKQLSAELVSGELTTALRFSDEQIAMGAHVLDVNVGAPMVDEVALLPELAAHLAARHQAPLSLDSSNPAAIAAALGMYPASALVNSINGDRESIETLGPLCRDFGAPFVLLPLKGRKLPETAKERIAVIDGVLQRMDELGIPKHLAVVDILVLTVSASSHAARECLDVIRYCTDVLHVPTVAGLSNISFGLPARELVNGAFLSMAVGAGLSGAIANPASARIRESIAASDLLLGNDPAGEAYIRQYAGWTAGTGAQTSSGTGAATALACDAVASLEDAVIFGRKERITELVQRELSGGADPFALVADRLIPAITIVGARYETKEYFLPQLIRSAETMQAAFAILKPLLEKDARSGERPVIITATVEGDIHDIGKNIVNLMLGNHGFDVVDLGKDVPAERIVAAACEKNARIIGLSALMTTTMVRMQDTVLLAREKGLTIPVMVGGAVVTPAFASSIGAVYAADAVDAVRVASELARAGEQCAK